MTTRTLFERYTTHLLRLFVIGCHRLTPSYCLASLHRAHSFRLSPVALAIAAPPRQQNSRPPTGSLVGSGSAADQGYV